MPDDVLERAQRRGARRRDHAGRGGRSSATPTLMARAALPVALPGQHARPAVGARGRRWAARRRWTTSPTPSSTRSPRDGFDLVWFLGVWQTGEAARAVSRVEPRLAGRVPARPARLPRGGRRGSPFAVRDYHVHADFGGDEALARLRERLRGRGLRLMLDFVPNHVAPDHPWVDEHPEFFIDGDRGAARRRSRRTAARSRPRRATDPRLRPRPVLRRLAGHAAAQLRQSGAAGGDARRAAADRRRSATASAATWRCWSCPTSSSGPGASAADAVLAAGHAAVRARGARTSSSWPRSTGTSSGRSSSRASTTPTTSGSTTGSSAGEARPVREHLYAGLDYQDHLARFLENHDEPRAAATFPPEVHRAAAVITFFTPGLRFFHRASARAGRCGSRCTSAAGPTEAPDEAIARLLRPPARLPERPGFRDGNWQLLAAAGMGRQRSSDDFIAFSWTGPGERRRLVAVNYADHRSQCYVGLPWGDLRGRTWRCPTDESKPSTTARATTSPSGGSISTCRPGGFTSST